VLLFVCFSNCPAIVKRHTPRYARQLQRGAGIGLGIDIGIGDGGGGGGGSVSDGEVASLAATQQASFASARLRHHHPPHLSHHRQHQQQQQHHMRLVDAGGSCPGPRRLMQAIRESPEISNNPADAR